uniref:Fibrinogen C-terminal domain-containing protein n=1 Tax=Amphimedon queenslandica TaxID=400682 RepID=A0A1X7V308_AMPQE
MLLYLVTKDSCASCTSNTVNDSPGFTGISGSIGSNLSLLQYKMDHLLDQIAQHDENTAIINNASMQNKMDDILQQITIHQISTDSFLRKIITSTTESDSTVDDILLAVNQLLALINVTLRPSSCRDINHILPNSPSGYYHVNTDHRVYCNMGELCGEKGGWTGLGFLNMSDLTQNCPSDFQEHSPYTNIRTCRRSMSNSGCSSVNLPTNDIAYTQICGRVIGYQKGITDALSHGSKDIASTYLDGVSITRGFAPREHVWSFIAGQRSNSHLGSNCPCNTGSTVSVPGFIGNHYYCESGNNFTHNDRAAYYNTDPLWDGEDCLSLESSCCKSKALPWFHRNYNASSASDLELRVCRTADQNDEDILIEMYEIYIK